jgi:hypothetical protein
MEAMTKQERRKANPTRPPDSLIVKSPRRLQFNDFSDLTVQRGEAIRHSAFVILIEGL